MADDVADDVEKDRPARTHFGRTVALGVLGAGGLALGGNRDWVTIDADARAEAAATVLWDSTPALGQMPLAGALGLVALACWGVLLVGRGLVRRALAVLAALAAGGAVAVWCTALVQLRGDVEAEVAAAVLPGEWSIGWTVWFPVTGLAALVALAAAVVAVRLAPSWPSMSSRYDAPGARKEEPVIDLAEADEADLWKAIDEGRDPT